MVKKGILQRLEEIYRKLPVRFHYPQVSYDTLFNVPRNDNLVNEFIKRAKEIDINVEALQDVEELKQRIQKIFATYKRLWIDSTLKKSPFFMDKPVITNQWEAEAGITVCRALIARTGSIILDSTQGRQAGLIAPNHFVLATAKQLYPDLSHFFEQINNASEPPSSISIISGPSRTADIEKKLVKGAHGPKHITVLILLNHH